MEVISSPQPLAVGEASPVITDKQIGYNSNISYASKLADQNDTETKVHIQLHPIVMDHGLPTVEFSVDEINKFTKEEGLHQAVIFKLSYGKPDLQDIRQILPKQLAVKGRCIIGQLEYRHILVRFDLFEDFAQVVSRSYGYLRIKGQEFFYRTFPWTMDFNPRKETSKAVIWISLPELPANLFAQKAILSIASSVGKPIAVDKATKDRSRPSTARVKVLVNLLDKHPSTIKIKIVDSKSGNSSTFDQKIVIDNAPAFCSYCCHQGHNVKSCRRMQESESVVTGLSNSSKKVDKMKGDARDFLNEKRDSQKRIDQKIDTVSKAQNKSVWKQKVQKEITKEDYTQQGGKGNAFSSSLVLKQSNNLVCQNSSVSDSIPMPSQQKHAEVRTEDPLEEDQIDHEVENFDKIREDASDLRSAQSVKDAQGKMVNAGTVGKFIPKQDDQNAQGVSEDVQLANFGRTDVLVKDSQLISNVVDKENMVSNVSMQFSASTDQNGQDFVSVHNDTKCQSEMTMEDKGESDFVEVNPISDATTQQEKTMLNEIDNLCNTIHIVGSNDRFDQEKIVSAHNKSNTSYGMSVEDKGETDFAEVNPNADAAVLQEMSAKLCSTIQILGSSGQVDQELMLNVNNCQSDLEEQDKMEEAFMHSNAAEFAAFAKHMNNATHSSNITMQMACSDTQNEQEYPGSKDQKKLDNEKKKSDGRTKERDLYNRVYTAAIKKEKQPKRNTVSLEDIKMSDFKLSLTFSIHEKGSSSEPNYDTSQQKTRSGNEMDQARLMADVIFGKKQLFNTPAYIAAISSSQESTVHQINNLSKVFLTADHNNSSTICDDCNTMANNTVSLLNQDKMIVEKKSISKSPVLFTGGRIQSVASYPIVPYTYIEQENHDVFSIFDDQNTPSVIPNRKELIIKSKLWDQRQYEYEEGWEDGSSGSSSSEDDDDNSLAIIFSQKKMLMK